MLNFTYKLSHCHIYDVSRIINYLRVSGYENIRENGVLRSRILLCPAGHRIYLDSHHNIVKS